MAPILRLSKVSKQYGAVKALNDVDFHVDAGEVVALVGDNGAGKSTLIKVMAGVAPADSGTVEFAGQPVSLQRPHDATRLGIATVYQDLALCDNLDVAGNLFLGREVLAARPWRYLRLTNKVEMGRRARDLLGTLRVEIRDVRAEVASLSGGQRQAVAIARSLLGDPQVVLLDEPTAALGVAQTAQVLQLIAELKRRGHAVVVISHNLADVFDMADRITVLRMGRNAGDFPIGRTTREEIVAAITGLDSRPDTGAVEPTGVQ
ncbi:ATP-binding cassette domain-containing protein [Actinophytocola sp.]|uniref:ATP-binding cassette domain-containing protein n=1 Tax=Actinophytocola sp. TaxID=1872138 RepID=UPI003899E09D